MTSPIYASFFYFLRNTFPLLSFNSLVPQTCYFFLVFRATFLIIFRRKDFPSYLPTYTRIVQCNKLRKMKSNVLFEPLLIDAFLATEFTLWCLQRPFIRMTFFGNCLLIALNSATDTYLLRSVIDLNLITHTYLLWSVLESV